jgi:hypothetical protein
MEDSSDGPILDEAPVDVHDHSPTAHRHFIGQMLDQVKHAVGRGVATSGEIVTPAVASSGRAVVGSWNSKENNPHEIDPRQMRYREKTKSSP